MPYVPELTLNNGVAMGQLGYGVYKVPAGDCAALVTEALGAGYRSLDTAALYDNEEGVGEAVRLAMSDDGGGAAASGGSPLARDDIFVTTKVWNDRQGYDGTLAAFDESLRKLGLEYVDLYLIHWPCPERNLFIQTYRALERLYRDGRVRAIGVSNFEPKHLRRLLDATDVIPAINQVELHPLLQQGELRAFNQEHGIRTEAWSPLGRGQLFHEPVLERIAAQLGRSVAQVVLRWHLQLGNIAIPKASSPARIRENLDVFDFLLEDAAMAQIAAMDRGTRFGSHPDTVN
ncbi:MAG TPA: aldo/keto reductase [Micrococcaceae bacterium]|jgi:diketogulonate reductase-like aldo/keto reductase